MKNILIIGKAGSGKDTAAFYIAKMHGYRQFALAERIREEFRRLYPDLDPRTNRDKMIEIGQGCKEMFGEDCWVRMCEEDINEYLFANPGKPVLIIDGRYKVEYDYFVTKLGYTPIRLMCPDEVRFQRLQNRDGTTQDDALEKESTELDNVDATPIDNSTDTTNLYANLDAFINSLPEDPEQPARSNEPQLP